MRVSPDARREAWMRRRRTLVLLAILVAALVAASAAHLRGGPGFLRTLAEAIH